MNKRPFWIRSVSLEGAESLTPNWAVKSLMRDYPGCMGALSAWYSSVSAGYMPHEIHSHDEEEIIVLLSGALDVVTPESSYRIVPGSFVYHPPGDRHSIRSLGPEPAEYLVFKWAAQKPPPARQAVTSFLFDASRLKPWSEKTGRYRQRVCENHRLAGGGQLTADVVRVTPLVGCPAHLHNHDVALVLLRGQMHALSQIWPAPAIHYYPAGMVHGVAPLSPITIDAIVFEFYRPPAS